MDIIRSTYKKIASLILCAVSVIGLATGVKGLTAGRSGSVGIIGGADGPTAVLVAEEDAPSRRCSNSSPHGRSLLRPFRPCCWRLSKNMWRTDNR